MFLTARADAPMFPPKRGRERTTKMRERGGEGFMRPRRRTRGPGSSGAGAGGPRWGRSGSRLEEPPRRLHLVDALVQGADRLGRQGALLFQLLADRPQADDGLAGPARGLLEARGEGVDR